MKHLKKYEFFSFKNKENWRSKIEWIIKNYKDEDIENLDAEVEERYDGSKSLKISWYDENFNMNNFIIFSDKNGNRVSSDEEYEKWPVISDEEFKRYEDGIQKISDYLDEKEKNKSFIDGSGDLNIKMDSNEIDAKANIVSHFSKYLKKEYKFEAEYYLWESSSKNKKIIENIKLKIIDISGDVRPYGRENKPDFYLTVECKLGKYNMKFMVDINSPTEYTPIEDIPRNEKYGKVIVLNHDTDSMTRIEKRNFDKRDYPHVISYNIIPSGWESIEFLKECNSFISALNNKL